jgi:hypothetical protein
MEENTCKICLEPHNLLIEVCACRGSVGGIHHKCLKQLLQYEQECSVCRSAFRFKVLHPLMHGQPFFWCILNSPLFELVVYAVMATALKFLHFSVSLKLQFYLFALHSVAYVPVFARWCTDPHYGRAWMRMWLRCLYCTYSHDGHPVKKLVTPFAALAMYFVAPFLPGLNILLNSNKRLWETHVSIVEIMAAQELAGGE